MSHTRGLLVRADLRAGLRGMSLVLVGDIHGAFHVLREVRERYPTEPIIQIGDFGVWPQLEANWSEITPPVYFIDGNHDYLPPLMKETQPRSMWPGAVYCPRGTVLELDGRLVGFIGGATSIDRQWRKEGSLDHGWFPEEEVTDRDVDAILARKPDIVIAHAAPAKTIERFFDPTVPVEMFGHAPGTWRDPSAERLQRLADSGAPYYCGHMHRSVIDGNVRILDV